MPEYEEILPEVDREREFLMIDSKKEHCVAKSGRKFYHEKELNGIHLQRIEDGPKQ